MLTGSWGLRKKMDLRLLVSNMRYTQKKKKRARLFLYSTRDVTDSRWSQKPISLKNCNFWVLFSSYSFLLRTCFVCFNYILALRSFCLVGRAQHGAFRERRNRVDFFFDTVYRTVSGLGPPKKSACDHLSRWMQWPPAAGAWREATTTKQRVS